jgi:hypothetical protein
VLRVVWYELNFVVDLRGRLLTFAIVNPGSSLHRRIIAPCGQRKACGTLRGLSTAWNMHRVRCQHAQTAVHVLILDSFWINYGVSQHSPNKWILPFAIQLVPGGLLVIGMFFLPESPRWCAASIGPQKAREVLAKVRNLPADHQYIEAELQQIVVSMNGTKVKVRNVLTLVPIALPGPDRGSTNCSPRHWDQGNLATPYAAQQQNSSSHW